MMETKNYLSNEDELVSALPLTGYVGGKSRLAKKIVGLMKPHQWYMEVFAGMLSIFLYKGKAQRNIVNDINNNLINLFRVVRDYPEEFIWKISVTPYSTDEFYKLASLIKNQDDYDKLDDITKAYVYYYVLDNAFNSQISKHITFSPSLSGAKSWANDYKIQNVYKLARYLNGVEITNYDFRTLLTFPWVIENADKWLIYLDPPYYISTLKDDYYEFRFTRQDHLDLYEILTKLKDAGISIVLSYDDHPFIRELYKDWELVVIPDVVQSSSSREGNPVRRNELVFLSYSVYELGLFAMDFTKDK